MHTFCARALTILLGLLLLAAMSPSMAKNEEKTTTVLVVVDVTKDGCVDWTHREVHAIGIGVAPVMARTSAQKKIYAREAAIVAAERNLLKIIRGVAIDSITTVEDMMLKEDIIVRRVNGLLQGAVIVKEKALSSDTYQVEMAINLYGAKSALAASVDLSSRVNIIPPPAPPAAPTVAQDNYTGLIVDCRGFALDRAMCPRIFDPRKNNLLDGLTVTADLLNERGLAAYFRALDDPELKRRVGARPLIVKAVGVEGKNRFKTDVVLSDADFALVAAENDKAGFLNALNIAFLIDRDR